MRKSPRKNQPRAVVGVRDLKVRAAEIVRHVRESNASYVVTLRGEPVGVLLPIDEAPGAGETGADAWEAFVDAGRKLRPRFRRGSSGVALLTSSRR